MVLKIYNTLTRQKEAFEPLQADQVSLYVCGPIYMIRLIRPCYVLLVFDIIRRYLISYTDAA
jgi:cysteinyl-tRNA synthetase